MNLAPYIELTYLRDDCTEEKIKWLCETALEKNYYGICCYPSFIAYANTILQGTGVVLVSVINFPHGLDKVEDCIEQAQVAVDGGVDELDIVLNYQALKEHRYVDVYENLEPFVRFAHRHHKKVKVIIESGELDELQIMQAVQICLDARADFIKTSTGFTPIGATVEAIQTIVPLITENIGIKASGGIKTREQAIAMIEAGATRIGTSSVL